METVEEKDVDKSQVQTAVVPAALKTTAAEAPKAEDLCPCLSLCCVNYSLYPVFPDCLGLYFKGVACACCQAEQLCCKVSKSDGSYCKVFSGECEIVEPVGCCKIAAQTCCLDARFAIPTDEEAPCMLACAGFICVKSFGCVCKFYDTKEAAQGQTPTKQSI